MHTTTPTSTSTSTLSRSGQQQMVRLAGAFLADYASAKTRQNYQTALRSWFEWLAEYAIDPLEAHRTHVELWTRHLEQRGYATNTISQRLSAVSSFYIWALTQEQVAVNPVAGARRPRRTTGSNTQALSRHELTDWLDAAQTAGGDVYAAGCLLALNGLRVGELCATNVADLGESTCAMSSWWRSTSGSTWCPCVRWCAATGQPPGREPPIGAHPHPGDPGPGAAAPTAG